MNKSEAIQKDLQQVIQDLEALSRVRQLMEIQRMELQAALRAARAADEPVAAPETAAEPTVASRGPRHAQGPDVTRVPPVSIRVSAFQGRTLWTIGTDQIAHVRIPSPTAGGVLCGADGDDWKPYTPDLSGYVWTCGECYQAMRSQG